MAFTVRKADMDDLNILVDFAISEAHEAEGITKPIKSVFNGVKIGLEDRSIAQYWVLEDGQRQIIGNVSVVKEWSNWNSGFYWWIQSIFIVPEHRGKGLITLLLQAVRKAANSENALEIRLYVHGKNTRAIKAYQKEGFQDSDYKIMTLKI